MWKITEKYNIPRGSIQSLHNQSCTFAGMLMNFTNKLGWVDIEFLINNFMDRLNFGVQAELVNLVQIPYIKGYRARQLYNAGYKSISSIANANSNDLLQLFRNSVPFKSKKSENSIIKSDAHNLKIESKLCKVIISEAKKLLLKEMNESNKMKEYSTNITPSPSSLPLSDTDISTQPLDLTNININNNNNNININTIHINSNSSGDSSSGNSKQIEAELITIYNANEWYYTYYLPFMNNNNNNNNKIISFKFHSIYTTSQQQNEYTRQYGVR